MDNDWIKLLMPLVVSVSLWLHKSFLLHAFVLYNLLSVLIVHSTANTQNHF